jgi:tetratricopeptide (TPR) repeat protein
MAAGYWPATVMQLVTDEQYAAAVQVCREHLRDTDLPLSGYAAYGLALFHAGQFEPAAEQFRAILARDPNYLVALRYLGDIAYALGDEWTALANYGRILELDPLSDGLHCPIPKHRQRETTRTISLLRHAEETSKTESRTSRIAGREPARKQAVLVSETIGDLYLAQGHARQAAEVFQKLYDRQPTSQLADKLARAIDKLSEKEPTHVAETDE